MSDLSGVPESALREELGRRAFEAREEEDRLRREAIRERFGVCQAEFGVTEHPFTIRSGEPFPSGPCGCEFRGAAMREVAPILVAPDNWPALLPCPPERCWQIGSELEFTLTCALGHETRFQETRMYGSPLKPTF